MFYSVSAMNLMAPSVAANAISAFPGPVVNALIDWSQSLQRLGVDRTREDGLQICQQLAVLNFQQGNLHLEYPLRTEGAQALLAMAEEDRHEMFREISPLVKAELHNQIRGETIEIEQSVGVRRWLRLGLFNSTHPSLFYRHTPRLWWRALSLERPTEVTDAPYQIFYPVTDVEEMSGANDSGVRKIHRLQAGRAPEIEGLRRFKTWELPGTKLSDKRGENLIGLAPAELMRMGGLTVMSFTTSDLETFANSENLSSLQAVDVLTIGGTMEREHQQLLNRLIWILQPVFTVISIPADSRDAYTHPQTEIVTLSQTGDNYGLLDFDPLRQEATVTVYDTATDETRDVVRLELKKVSRIRSTLEQVRRRTIETLKQEIAEEFGDSATASIHAGVAINKSLGMVTNYISDREHDPYRSAEEDEKALRLFQAVLDRDLRSYDPITLRRKQSYHERAFELLLEAWGMAQP